WQTDNCNSTLAASASCAISVYFAPKALGTWTGQMLVYDSASGSPQSVQLTGTGTVPVAALSPTSLTFNNQVIGTTSAPQPVTLTNTGNAALGISSITTPTPFAQTNNCGTSVPAGATCTINVTFTATLAGTTDGFLYVTDASDGTLSVSLFGTTGPAPAVTLSSTSLTFGSQQVGTTSAAQALTLTNSGSAPLTVSSIAASGDFAQTNNCGTSLAIGASCGINVTFTPSAIGSRAGALNIIDNALNSPQTASLTGLGASATGSGPALVQVQNNIITT